MLNKKEAEALLKGDAKSRERFNKFVNQSADPEVNMFILTLNAMTFAKKYLEELPFEDIEQKSLADVVNLLTDSIRALNFTEQFLDNIPDDVVKRPYTINDAISIIEKKLMAMYLKQIKK